VSPTVLEHFPTNWELSTARATNVVRFLETEGGIPGDQLVAAGFASYRPAASNQSEAGRRRNRRIEMILFRKVRN
jgi:chemotaxis protein MotB